MFAGAARTMRRGVDKQNKWYTLARGWFKHCKLRLAFVQRGTITAANFTTLIMIINVHEKMDACNLRGDGATIG
jgi:hypothetical protein